MVCQLSVKKPSRESRSLLSSKFNAKTHSQCNCQLVKLERIPTRRTDIAPQPLSLVFTPVQDSEMF